ncbi:DUF2892 domain-containing protein, partial [bacterium]|nr:DUF2892 domain-containing protein [bacterium]
VGTADRIIRIIIAVVIFALGAAFKSWWGLLGLIPLLTAIFGFCGLYSLLGISTCKRATKEEPAK